MNGTTNGHNKTQPVELAGPKFRVAICGGGPGGLALAVTLARFNNPLSPVAIDIYESQPELATVGAGITVWPRTHTLLRKLGVMNKLEGELGLESDSHGQDSGEDPHFTFRKSDEKEGYTFFTFYTPVRTIMIHRSALLKALQSALPEPPLCNVHTSSRLTSYEYTPESPIGDSSVYASPLTLHFADGSTAFTDILIGADGIRSAVRKTMFCLPAVTNGSTSVDAAAEVERELREKADARWSGTVAYRSLIRKERLEERWKDHRALRELIFYCGTGKHLAVYPISRGQLVNVVAFVTIPQAAENNLKFPGKWVQDVTIEEMQEAYAGWEPEVQALLESVDSSSKWAIHIHGKMPRYTDQLVAILGDAAHAMETHFGAGAGQAMEDAHILGRLLTHPLTNRSNLQDVLSVYETIRRPFANGVVNATRKVGQLYEFEGISTEGRSRASNASECRSKLDINEHPESESDWAEIWGKQVSELWQWQWENGPDIDWLKAEEMLQERLGRGNIDGSSD